MATHETYHPSAGRSACGRGRGARPRRMRLRRELDDIERWALIQPPRTSACACACENLAVAGGAPALTALTFGFGWFHAQPAPWRSRC